MYKVIESDSRIQRNETTTTRKIQILYWCHGPVSISYETGTRTEIGHEGGPRVVGLTGPDGKGMHTGVLPLVFPLGFPLTQTLLTLLTPSKKTSDNLNFHKYLVTLPIKIYSRTDSIPWVYKPVYNQIYDDDKKSYSL